MVSDPQTLVQRAYLSIRAMAVAGELLAGTKLVVRPLSESLGLSATPIKSALAALERDGFLTAIPNRGYFVPEISHADMLEIYEIREALDGIACRKVAGTPTAEAFVRDVLEPIYARQEISVNNADVAQLRDLDLEFHRAIWHAGGNKRLSQIADNLGGQIRLAWGRNTPWIVERAIREHRAIMDAIAACDPDAAEESARAHVRQSLAAFERTNNG